MTMMDQRKTAGIWCAVLVALTLGVFIQTWNHQFINLDDPLYVTNNPYVKGGITGNNILWAFTTTAASNWHPLTWMSHMFDVEIFGVNPHGHHVMSVLIHTASTLLLFLLILQISAAPWQSLFAAALFALHPLHVESVAWVAERKDVLSGFFWFLTLLFYASYVKRQTVRAYFLTLFSFVLGLMAKPMLVTLPLAMLLLDYWPLNRLGLQQMENRGTSRFNFLPLLKEKIPFFLFSALSAAITIYAQNRGGAMKSFESTPFAFRIGNAAIAYVKYVGKTIWPQDLAILYPFPASLPLWQVLGSTILILFVSVTVIRDRRRYPYLLAGWLWFLVTLVPVIGFVQVGGQAMADRYTYIPLIGLFIMCSWGVPDLLRSWLRRGPILAILAGLVISASTVATWRQLGYWKDNISLYQHTLQLTTGNYLILNNYGIALADEGRLDEAIMQYQDALRAWPKSATAHVNLGAALAHQGKYLEAIEQYSKALRLIPDYALAHANLARALVNLGRTNEAITHYEEALKIDPNFGDAHLNLGILLVMKGEYHSALEHYDTFLQLEPYSAKGPINMGAALARAGKITEAIRCFNKALGIDPKSVEAHFNLGIILAGQNRREEAISHFTVVLNLRPDLQAARHWIEDLQHRR